MLWVYLKNSVGNVLLLLVLELKIYLLFCGMYCWNFINDMFSFIVNFMFFSVLVVCVNYLLVMKWFYFFLIFFLSSIVFFINWCLYLFNNKIMKNWEINYVEMFVD